MDAAVTSRFPRHRYMVGLDANLLYIPLSHLHSWIGDTIWNLIAPTAIPAAIKSKVKF